MKETLYLKGEDSVELENHIVKLGDLVQMECADAGILARLKSLKIFQFQDTSVKPKKKMNSKDTDRRVVSILYLIQRIHQLYPNLQIQNLGAQDIVVLHKAEKDKGRAMHWIKVLFVVMISFSGSAFSIMAFNNDVDTTKLFHQFYHLIMGKRSDGFTVLELTYSIGIALGVFIFFNHFGKKKFSSEPTPMEVEMRIYEKDIRTTLIENAARNGKEIE